jgi:hypothetical protein
MSPPLHQRLLNEATQHGTEEVLRQMPATHSPELEQAVRQGVRQALLYYAWRLDHVDRQLHPLGQGRSLRA